MTPECSPSDGNGECPGWFNEKRTIEFYENDEFIFVNANDDPFADMAFPKNETTVWNGTTVTKRFFENYKVGILSFFPEVAMKRWGESQFPSINYPMECIPPLFDISSPAVRLAVDSYKYFWEK